MLAHGFAAEWFKHRHGVSEDTAWLYAVSFWRAHLDQVFDSWRSRKRWMRRRILSGTERSPVAASVGTPHPMSQQISTVADLPHALRYTG